MNTRPDWEKSNGQVPDRRAEDEVRLGRRQLVGVRPLRRSEAEGRELFCVSLE